MLTFITFGLIGLPLKEEETTTLIYRGRGIGNYTFTKKEYYFALLGFLTYWLWKEKGEIEVDDYGSVTAKGLNLPYCHFYDIIANPANEAKVSNYKFTSNASTRQQIAKQACENYQKYLEEDKKISYTTRVSVNAKLSDITIISSPYEERPIEYIAECNFTFNEGGASTQKKEIVPVACKNEITDSASDCYFTLPRTEKEIQKSEEREKERKQADRERETNRKAEEKCKRQCILDWTSSTGNSCPVSHQNYSQCYKCQKNCE